MRPSRSWENVWATPVAALAVPAATAAFGPAGDAGSVAVSAAATRYSTPTVAIRTGAPARLTRMGPSRANPTAIEPLRVIMNSVFAWRSWSRFTSWGIIAASAGAKNVVTVETTMFSR